jgi:hypothetical protein
MLSFGKLALLAQTQDMDAVVDEKSLDGTYLRIFTLSFGSPLTFTIYGSFP